MMTTYSDYYDKSGGGENGISISVSLQIVYEIACANRKNRTSVFNNNVVSMCFDGTVL